MTAAELRDKIKVLVKQAYADRQQAEVAAVEYDELTKFPELKEVIVDLLGPQFDLFLASIYWVGTEDTESGAEFDTDTDADVDVETDEEEV